MVRLPISYLIRNLYHLQTDSSSSTDDNFQLKQNKIIGLQFSLKFLHSNVGYGLLRGGMPLPL